MEVNSHGLTVIGVFCQGIMRSNEIKQHFGKAELLQGVLLTDYLGKNCYMRSAVHSTYCVPQTDMTTIIKPVNDSIPASLVDESAPPKEVNNEIRFSFIQGTDEIDEVENDEGDEEREWDDGNETDEVEENLHLYDDDDDDDDDDIDADD